MLNVVVCGLPLLMELDTGSDSTFITEQQWREMGSPKLRPSSSTFSTFKNEVFKSAGEFAATVEHNGQCVSLIVDVSKSYSIVGRDFLSLFQVDWNSVKQQCGQGFSVKPRVETSGIGSLTSRECRLDICRAQDSGSGVSPPSSLKPLLEEYKNVFDAPVGVIRDFKAKLILKEDASPKFYKPRPVPFAYRHKVDADLEKM